MLQQRIGRLFAGLAGLSFLFNAFVDRSPEASFNTWEMVCVGPVFFLTSVYRGKIGQAIQLVTMSVCAMISFRLSEAPYFGFAIITIMCALIYAYGGYQTFQGIKVALTLCVIYVLCFASIVGFIPLSFETAFKAFNWTMAIMVFGVVLWWIIEFIEMKFHQKLKEEINRNRIELESIKKLAGGCNDGAERR